MLQGAYTVLEYSTVLQYIVTVASYGLVLIKSFASAGSKQFEKVMVSYNGQRYLLRSHTVEESVEIQLPEEQLLYCKIYSNHYRTIFL